MKKIEFQGETYYYENGKFYDNTFVEMSRKDSNALSAYYLKTIDLRALKFDEFISLVNRFDNGGNYSACVSLIEKGFEIFFDYRDYAKLMLPKLFRLYSLPKQFVYADKLSEKLKALQVWE